MPTIIEIQDLESIALATLDLSKDSSNFILSGCGNDPWNPCGDTDNCDGDCGCDEIV